MPTNNPTPVWFITGCSTGFGLELAKLVLARGWRAVLTARKPEALAALAAEHQDHALVLKLDVTSSADIEQAVSEAEARFGQIDVLVNNAGYGYLAAIEEGEEEGIRAQFETNVFGLLALTKRVLPAMRKRRGGHIVNFSSIGGLCAFAATGYYHATKFAVEALSESLSIRGGTPGHQGHHCRARTVPHRLGRPLHHRIEDHHRRLRRNGRQTARVDAGQLGQAGGGPGARSGSSHQSRGVASAAVALVAGRSGARPRL